MMHVGIPESLVHNGTGEFTGKHKEFVKEARKMHIKTHTMEQGWKNQNHAAKQEIGILTQHWKLQMQKKKVSKHLWDFGIVYKSELLTRMARDNDHHTSYEEVTGQTLDISKWTDFEFYDLIWWLHCPNKLALMDETRQLA
jgi:hypothetical protein